MHSSAGLWAEIFDFNLCTFAPVSFVHKAKGGEADNVALVLDCPKIIKDKGDTDSEHRVFYVGATRARKTLHIIEPKDENGYKI